MATLGDVAARAGVSISAVSRVLSNAPATRVSEATRERIFAAARELDYRPNFAGRALKSAKTRVLGLVVPDLTNALFTELMHGVEDEASEHDYVVLLGRATDERANSEVYDRLIGEGRVDGLIVQVADGVATTSLETLLDRQAPLVLINSTAPGRVGSVLLDDETGARLATEHMVSLGHSRIGFANGLPSSLTANRRQAGYESAMRSAGLQSDPAYVTRFGYHPEDGRRALAHLMAMPAPPTALVVANVNAAVGALAAARASGLAIPADLSVACVHDSWTAENTWPPLTAVRMPFYEMGRAAVRNLLGRLTSGAVGDEVITDPQPELVVRESTALLH